MKKQKPITLKRSKIRESTRKPMPPPSQEHTDKRRRDKYPPKDADQD